MPNPEAPIYAPVSEQTELPKLELTEEEQKAVSSIILGIEEVAEDVREYTVLDVISTLENGHPLNRIIKTQNGEAAGYLAFEDFIPHEAYIKYFGINRQLDRNLLREIPVFLEYAKAHGYTKLNFHGWNPRLNHIMERYGFKRLHTDNMGEFSVDFYEKSLVEEKTSEDINTKRIKAFEQKFLAKIQKDYEQTLRTFSEENRPEKERAITEAYQTLASRLQATEDFDFNERAQAILKLKLARHFQTNESIDFATIYDAIIETPKFLQSDKGSLFRLFEVHQQKILEKIAENRKNRAEMTGKEEFNPYEALFTTKSGKYYVARLLNMPHLEEESDYMNHCVGTSGSYINRIKKGEVEILSFRHMPEIDPNTHELTIDTPIITIAYNQKTKTIEQMKKHGDEYLQRNDPFYDDFVDALKKLRLTETGTGEKRSFKQISESELESITVSDYHVLTENGEVNFRDFDPDSGVFVLKIGSMRITNEIPMTDVRKILQIVEGINVNEDEIAIGTSGLVDKTRVYIGPLFKDLWYSYPNLENIYTSFPEGKIRKSNLEIGGKTKDELVGELKARGINISEYAQNMLDSPDFTTQPNPEQINLVRLRVRDLGLPNGATTDQIYAKAEEFGLELCPAEVGPHQRLKDGEQSLDDWYWTAMRQITDRYGDPNVFDLAHNDDGLWLSNCFAKPDNEWNAGSEFVFRLRKFSQES